MNIFYNRAQDRFRSLWRIVFYAVAVAVLVIGVVLILGLLAGIWAMVGGVDAQQIGQAIGSWFNPAAGGATGLPLALLASSAATTLALAIGMLFALRKLDKRSIASLGFHLDQNWWRDAGFGFGLGLVLMVAIFLVEWASGSLSIRGFGPQGLATGEWIGGICLAFLAFVLVALGEELLLRGYLLRNLAEGFRLGRIGPRGAVLIALVLSSVVFGLLHLPNQHSSAVSTVNLMVAGLFLGLAFILSGELALPLGFHLSWNFFQGNVFGFPVSGTPAGPSLISINQQGAAWFTGGPFGPEAGVIGLAALAAGTALLVLWLRRGGRRVGIKEGLALYVPPAATPRIAALPQKARQGVIPAAYLVLLRDGQVLLLRRFQTGYEDGKYSLVAGHVEKGESFTACVIREAAEEAGLVLAEAQLRVGHVMHRHTSLAGYGDRVDVFFVAESWEGEPDNREPDKCDDLSWFSLDELPANLIPYVRQAIEAIRNGVPYSEFGW